MNEESYTTLDNLSIHDKIRIAMLESSKANVAHQHLITDVQDLKDTLASKSTVGHDHDVANITELQNLLDSKADLVHTHPVVSIQVKDDTPHIASASLSFPGSTVEGQGDVVIHPQQISIYEGQTLVGIFPREIKVQSKLIFNSGLRVSASGDQNEIITVDVSNSALGDYLNLTTGGTIEGDLFGKSFSVLNDFFDGVLISLNNSGSITAKGSEGEFGQVLTSGGANSAAFWSRPASSTSGVSTIRSGEFNDISIGSAQDLNVQIRHCGVKNITLTLQNDSVWYGADSAMPIGGSFTIGKHGFGNILIQAGTGVTINAAESLSLTRPHGKLTLLKVSQDTWDLF